MYNPYSKKPKPYKTGEGIEAIGNIVATDMGLKSIIVFPLACCSEKVFPLGSLKQYALLPSSGPKLLQDLLNSILWEWPWIALI